MRIRIAAAFATGLLIGCGGTWLVMVSYAERHLAHAEAVNASMTLRAVEALRNGQPEQANEWLKTGLVGNVVVLGAWADAYPPSSQELPVKTLRRIASYDSEVVFFTRAPEFRDFFDLLDRYAAAESRSRQ